MMKFTGERFVPQIDSSIKYEHLYQCALGLEFSEGRSVLDIGVKSVDHPQAGYVYLANLKSLAGSCNAVPLADDLIEFVTSFETIGYHGQRKETVQEIKSFSGDADSLFKFTSCFPPMYFVAVCSNHKEFFSANLESIYLDKSDVFDKT